MRAVRIKPPTEAPVSLAQLKEHVRVEHAASDTVLQSLIDAATAHLDGVAGVLGRCIVSQTWRQDFAAWANPLRLPFPSVSAVVSVTYADADGVMQTVDPAGYALAETYGGAEVRLKSGFSWPAIENENPAPVSVAFTAGFGAAADVPWSIKVAIMMLAAHWHENREAVVVGTSAANLPLAFDALISPYRVVTL